MRLVVGLGNPGPRYAATRHNVGFRIVERLAADSGIALDQDKFGGHFGHGQLQGHDVALLEPLGYMNRSGEAVREAVRRLDVEPANLLVVLDDVDLPFARIRLRASGGDGGHRGLRDILYELDTQEFPRLRFGVGRPDAGETSDYVLEPFSDEEEVQLSPQIERAAHAISTWICEGVATAMDRFNSEVREPGSVDANR